MKKKDLKRQLDEAQARHERLDAYAREQAMLRRNAELDLARQRDADVRAFLGDYSNYLKDYADFINSTSVLLLGRDLPRTAWPKC